jgi:hypothetical protein
MARGAVKNDFAIKPARPAGAADKLIEIGETPKGAKRPVPKDPFKVWDQYYASHDDSPAKVQQTLDGLPEANKNRESEAVIKGYLKHHSGRAEPWMYELLGKIAVERSSYWIAHFKKKDETPGDLLQWIIPLRAEKKMLDVEAVLRGYLTQRIQRAEPWMYEMLAATVEERKGPPQEIRTYLGYAAFKAIQKGANDNLLSCAALLVKFGIYDKVGPPGKETTAGELIDRLIRSVPHRFEPLSLSVELANRTKDPRRMGDTIDTLLSLGWPNVDDAVRSEARKQVDAMAKELRSDGRIEEADALFARLAPSLSRDVHISLRWEGVDDIDLVVDEPLGATCSLLKNPRTILGGAIIANGFGKHPEEIYVCPRGFPGKYTIRVDKIFQPNNPAKVANLEVVTHEGTAEEKRETFEIDLTKPKPVVVELKGGRRKEPLPFVAPPRQEPLVVPGDAPKGQPPQPKPR